MPPSSPSPTPPVYSQEGVCPICETATVFTAATTHYRNHLRCPHCPGGSIPRERALMLVLKNTYPNWKSLRIHESSPAMRGASAYIKAHCSGYIASQYYPDIALGEEKDGYINQNLEQQTFADSSFDIAISLDVMEHLNRPDVACQEIARTLRPGGAYIFTAPTYKGRDLSVRRAIFHTDGAIEHLAPPEYHGNPINPQGSLVTFHYGYDFPSLIEQWSGLAVTAYRFHKPRQGIIGEMTEVYLCEKPS